MSKQSGDSGSSSKKLQGVPEHLDIRTGKNPPPPPADQRPAPPPPPPKPRK